MLATIWSTTLEGLKASLVRVEVEAVRGPCLFELVGMAEVSVRESRVRVRSALSQQGISLDEERIVVNLAPGDVRKTGSAFDLAVAVGTARALGHLPEELLHGCVCLGELSLTGELRPVRGVLPQLMMARDAGMTRAIVPIGNGPEAAVVAGLETLTAGDLSEVLAYFRKEQALALAQESPRFPGPVACAHDLSELRGQAHGRRSIEVAAAGHHHVLMIGPPGGGKTMLARRLPGIMPPLQREENLAASAVHSVAGLLPAGVGLLCERPFRSPHHTVSEAGLVGGGYPPRPGEISLAHHGVLFLDELTEFQRRTLETLRQPLEDGELTLARARSNVTYPCRPLLVAASNPCPCGHFGDGRRACQCSPKKRRRYLQKLSGPLLDRFDIQLHLPPVEVAALTKIKPGEPSSSVRKRVEAARLRQWQRQQAGQVRGLTNGELSLGELERVAPLDAASSELLTTAIRELGLSARAYGKIRRLCRTLADLRASDVIGTADVAEAIEFRSLDLLDGNTAQKISA